MLFVITTRLMSQDLNDKTIIEIRPSNAKILNMLNGDPYGCHEIFWTIPEYYQDFSIKGKQRLNIIAISDSNKLVYSQTYQLNKQYYSSTEHYIFNLIYLAESHPDYLEKRYLKYEAVVEIIPENNGQKSITKYPFIIDIGVRVDAINFTKQYKDSPYFTIEDCTGYQDVSMDSQIGYFIKKGTELEIQEDSNLVVDNFEIVKAYHKLKKKNENSVYVESNKVGQLLFNGNMINIYQIKYATKQKTTFYVLDYIIHSSLVIFDKSINTYYYVSLTEFGERGFIVYSLKDIKINEQKKEIEIIFDKTGGILHSSDFGTTENIKYKIVYTSVKSIASRIEDAIWPEKNRIRRLKEID
ncbi:hypothetical protein Spica_1593 [Gracilinema caldarium DSM 7334]|uniref:Uncharacterized protein n=2 Tax=Gracilinema caldarium TaxID=215591 RepID=F8F0M9_GRAC1|nr:hypothetical protein Spica_1593 [Gracilinema caldarium DSM 7334]